MSDPDLYIDEHIFLRTQGILINSIPFEGILTNKRIILIDKTANLLPRMEIPLLRLRNIEAAENTSGDKIIILTIQTAASEMRELMLTFPCQTTGIRMNERDAWLRILKWIGILKKNASSLSLEQVIHTVVPDHEQGPPGSEEIRPPLPNSVPVVVEPPVKKEVIVTPPGEWIQELSPPYPVQTITKIYEVSPTSSGTFSLPERDFHNLLFGIIFLILLIICPMILSLTSTLSSWDSLSTSPPLFTSTPVDVSLNQNPRFLESIQNQVPTQVPPGNSATAIPDTNLGIADSGSSHGSETISPFVTIEPKVVPEVPRTVFLQSSIAQKYSEDYVTIYSLTDQNVSQFLPLVSFTLNNPPLMVDYNFTPLSQQRVKHVEYKILNTNYQEDLEINRSFENSRFRIIVRNKNTGDVISEDGIGGNYSLQTPKQLVVREKGNFSFEFTGEHGILDLTMKVKQEGNLPPAERKRVLSTVTPLPSVKTVVSTQQTTQTPKSIQTLTTIIPATTTPPPPTPVHSTTTFVPARHGGMTNIVATIKADGRFTNLVSALQTANLADTLSDPDSNFTIFAPTDTVFQNLPPGTMDTLSKDPQGDLLQILLYHMVNGKVMAADLRKLSSVETLQGGSLRSASPTTRSWLMVLLLL